MREVIVNKKASKSLKEFFPWVYKSDILTKIDDISLVKILDENKKFLAVGYINPKSTISIRVLSFKEEKIDKNFFIKRIQKALIERVDIDSNAKRIIHSEGDFLPGIILDSYDDHLSLFFNTAAILKFKNEILEAIGEVLTPKSIVISGDLYSLKKEGIKDFKSEIIGEIPNEIVIEENGIKFIVDILEGQKTGFYLDQRKNRKILTRYIKQKSKVLDLFCNTGGFGLYGAKIKDAQITAVDISQKAIQNAKKNFLLNSKEATFITQNAFDYLRVLRKEKKKFDMVIIDPPSFAKSKAQKSTALRGFKDLAVNGLKVTEDEGYLAIFSCSYYIDLKDLEKILLKASKDTQKQIKIIEHLYQDIDHPYILNNPYSLYLKGLLVKIV